MANPTRQLIGHAQAIKIQELYALKNEYGRRQFSIQNISDRFNCSETTVFRIVNRTGAYKDIKPPLTEEQLSDEAMAASVAEVVRLVNAPVVNAAERELAELSPGAAEKAKKFLSGEGDRGEVVVRPLSAGVQAGVEKMKSGLRLSSEPTSEEDAELLKEMGIDPTGEEK